MEEMVLELGGESFSIGPPEDNDWPWIIDGLEVSYRKDVPPGHKVDSGKIRERVVQEVERLKGNLILDNELYIARNNEGEKAAYLWIFALPLQYTGEMRGWMFQLYVSDDFRNLGLGKALMKLGEDWTLSLGMESIAVNVGAGNEAGVGILRSMGFEIEGYNMGKKLRSGGAPDKE